MLTLHADLLATQTAASRQPAIQCVFTCANPPSGQNASYDYSFDPTVTTNRLLRIEHTEEPYDGRAGILLRNNDRAVPNLEGYYVDLGYGSNTSSGLRYAPARGRLWVNNQKNVSASRFVGKADLFVELELWDIWAVMRRVPAMIGSIPYFQADNGDLIPGSRWSADTIYEVLEEIIETFLTYDTGFSFSLSALGPQDDGIVSTQIPLTSDSYPVIYPNRSGGSISGINHDTYAWLLADIMTWTKSFIRAKGSLTFEIIYPQETDSPNETYYSSLSSGHVFYENADRRFVLVPNHVVVYANQLIDEETGDETWTVVGNAYDPDEYPSPPTYAGTFTKGVKKIVLEPSITNQADAENRAWAYLSKAQAEVFGGRVYIPHDGRIELYDRVAIFDTR